MGKEQLNRKDFIRNLINGTWVLTNGIYTITSSLPC
jgi:hypothetical protein